MSDYKLKFIIENLKDFSPVKFYKKFEESYNSRKDAEEDLLSHLEALKRRGKARESRKAGNYIDRFDELIKSKACNRYWDNRNLQMVKKRAENRKAIHERHVEFNVYDEHDAVSSRIARATVQNATDDTKKVAIQS